ncbi:uncharacterized protein BDR25DRAFT_311780 [Lindgomyces ingoldianus]|uniref:Uncharacterized protein n=1 Tax=Lindgomyces ingoldianus TaxID=673940 RepID=A0ACB6R2N1_9PLEO|nr:uncharacterized protein BDR25DRAFT_311780 [Lindgomyces ingoldianus]KAF2473538.1 hypothetical protein BDR25DRAFT_311780 [Lindgomyces ingoldianus]
MSDVNSLEEFAVAAEMELETAPATPEAQLSRSKKLRLHLKKCGRPSKSKPNAPPPSFIVILPLPHALQDREREQESPSPSIISSSSAGSSALSSLSPSPAYPPFPIALTSHSAQHFRNGALITISAIRPFLADYSGPYINTAPLLHILRKFESAGHSELDTHAKRDGRTYALEALKDQIRDLSSGRGYITYTELEALFKKLDDHTHHELVMVKDSCPGGWDPEPTDREMEVCVRTPVESEEGSSEENGEDGEDGEGDSEESEESEYEG